jgi:hypothetical protein
VLIIVLRLPAPLLPKYTTPLEGLKVILSVGALNEYMYLSPGTALATLTTKDLLPEQQDNPYSRYAVGKLIFG